MTISIIHHNNYKTKALEVFHLILLRYKIHVFAYHQTCHSVLPQLASPQAGNNPIDKYYEIISKQIHITPSIK